jgi:rhomboid protease GluP
MSELAFAPILAAAVGGYAAIVVGWLVLLRRWRLAGPLAPPRAVQGRQEYVARRSLKALLAFDALVVLPAALGLATFAIAAQAPDMVFLVLAAVVFVAPVRPLRRNVLALEARRLAGIPEPTPAEQRSTGHEALDRLLRRPVYATRALASVIVAVSVAAWFVPGLQEVLEKRNQEILSGQLWRLATVALVHVGPIHLFFNVSVFLDVAGIVERLAGSARMLIVFWIGTVAATLASVAVMPAPAVGASGGVFAVLGALLAIAVRHHRELPPGVRTRLVRSTATAIGLNVVLGFVLPHVDWAAHLGGVVAGAALGWLLGLDREARLALSGSPVRGEGASGWRS